MYKGNMYEFIEKLNLFLKSEGFKFEIELEPDFLMDRPGVYLIFFENSWMSLADLKKLEDIDDFLGVPSGEGWFVTDAEDFEQQVIDKVKEYMTSKKLNWKDDVQGEYGGVRPEDGDLPEE